MDEHTPQLYLPLPHPDHLLIDDVARLRTALTRLDGHLAYGEFVLGLSAGLGIEPPLPGLPGLPGGSGEPGGVETVLAEEIDQILLSAFEAALGNA